MQRKGQVSVEYLLVVAFAFLMLMPIIVIYFSESARMQDEVYSAQALQAQEQILEAIEEVYYLGPPSKQTITVHFPPTVRSVTISSTEIVFQMDSTTGPYALANPTIANVSGSLQNFPGKHTIQVLATETSVELEEQ